MTFDFLAEVQKDTHVTWHAHSRGGQYNGPCPWCGGRDRFRVQPYHGSYGWFICSQCKQKGTAIDYLMLKRQMWKGEALALVGWTPRNDPGALAAIPRHAQTAPRSWSPPDTSWQKAASAFMKACQEILLYAPAGADARDYCFQRGLTLDTLTSNRLGYNPETRPGARAWGRSLTLPHGLVFPWIDNDRETIWRLTIRDATKAVGDPQRYAQVAGGSNGLYRPYPRPPQNAQSLAVLVEGEFDALSVAQSCGDQAAVFATGTTQGSHTPRWTSLLAQYERVLIAFDAEEKGDTAAQWWLDRLSNAKRLRPWWGDASQMLQDGVDLRLWLQTLTAKRPEAPVSHASREHEGVTKQKTRDESAPVVSSSCCECYREVEYYTPEGKPYCDHHGPDASWETFDL